MNYETGSIGGKRDGGQVLTDGRPRSRRVWVIVGIVLAALVLVGALFAFRSGKPAADGPGGKEAAAASGKRGAGQAPTVSVAVPGRKTVDRVLSATGSLAARREMPVGVAGEGGLVSRVLVEPGDWVAAGQVLAVVDRSVQTQTAASLAAGISVAQSDAALARSEYERAKTLVGRGFISKADLERKAATLSAANARVNVARAQLAEARARTSRLDIRSPAAGLVLTRAVEPGQIVSAGSGTLFRVAKGGEMEMRAELSESDLLNLPVGARATVTPVGSAVVYKGQVWQVSPVIDPQTRRGIARVALSYDKALRPGGFASASIASGSSSAPLLPNSAILSDAQGNYVYVVAAGDQVERRAIKVGDVSDLGVAVIDGLTGAERVVLSAGAFLNPGQKIKPVLRTL